MYTSTRLLTTTILLMSLLPLIGGCQERQVDCDAAVPQLQVENELAGSGQPYLELDVHSHQIKIMVGKTTLRELPFQFNDSDSLAGNWPELSAIARAHLKAAVPTVPPEELEVVAEATGARADQIQRYLPADLLLVTSTGDRISISTEVAGEPLSGWRNLIEGISYSASGLAGGRRLRLRMAAADAMAIYGLTTTQPSLLLHLLAVT